MTALEDRSIHVLREAYATLPRIAMLWSIGKDSTVMLWLARKAFFGRVPFPLVHVDTSFKIPEMIAWRDRLVAGWGLTLIEAKADDALAARRTFPDGAIDRVECCRTLKTGPLRRVIAEHRFGGVIVGMRADEEGSRSKERVFSVRDAAGRWDVSRQPAELWGCHARVPAGAGAHVRVHPLLEWTEADVWAYIAREKIPVTPLYFDRGDGRRYRSLGCAPCTAPIESTARDADEVLVELTRGPLANVAERAGRAQDAEDGGGLEQLRRGGYM